MRTVNSPTVPRKVPSAAQGPLAGLSLPDCGYSALRRIYFIHERLSGGRRANATDLGQALEVAARTVKRDIEFMRDQLGAPLEWEPSTGTYFYSRECDLLPLLRLEADEALALVLAGRTFAAWRGSPLGRALSAALGKIAGVVGGAVSLPADEISELVFQPEGAPGADAEHRFFALALEAIRRRRELRIAYHKPGAKSAEQRLIHPLHLAFLDHRWMLVAFDPARRAPRNFLLSRLRSAEPTGARFKAPAGFDLKRYLRGSLGRFTGSTDHEVRIVFDATVAPYIRENPWHPSQTLRPLSGGRLEASFRLNNLIDIRRHILACGAHAELLSPEELRASLRSEISSMGIRYQANPGPGDFPFPEKSL